MLKIFLKTLGATVQVWICYNAALLIQKFMEIPLSASILLTLIWLVSYNELTNSLDKKND